MSLCRILSDAMVCSGKVLPFCLSSLMFISSSLEWECPNWHLVSVAVMRTYFTCGPMFTDGFQSYKTSISNDLQKQKEMSFSVVEHDCTLDHTTGAMIINACRRLSVVTLCSASAFRQKIKAEIFSLAPLPVSPFEILWSQTVRLKLHTETTL